MEKDHYDIRLNKELFGLDYLSGIPEEAQESRINLATGLLKKFGDEEIYQAWFNYLKTSVLTYRQAWSFMLWFFAFDGLKIKTKNPYPFLALLFIKLGLSFENQGNKGDQEEMFETFDSIYVSMLIESGLFDEGDYFLLNPYRDERLANEIEKIIDSNA